jgi:hypothetical protein
MAKFMVAICKILQAEKVIYKRKRQEEENG